MPDGVSLAGGASPSGAAAAPTPTPVDESLLDELPGGEMLRGATEVKPAEIETAEWNAEDDEEAGDSLKPVSEEVEAKPEGEKAEDDDGDDEEEEAVAEATLEIPADWPEEAKSRLTALSTEKETLAKEKEALTAKVTDLEGKVATGPAPVLVPTRSNPLTHVRDVKGLEANQTFARELKKFAFRSIANGGEMPKELQAALEGTTVDKITEARTVTPEEAQDLHEQAEEMLSRHIPARQQYLTQEQEAHAELQRLAPEMLKADSDEAKIFSAFLQQFPEAKLMSRWPTMLAATVIGHRVLEERAKKLGGAPGAEGSKTKSTSKNKISTITPIAPATPAPPSGAAKPVVGKPPRREVQLSASMDADELAATM